LIEQDGKKGPTLLILLTVAVTFAALGIFLDGEVLPTLIDIQKLVIVSVVQSNQSRRRTNSTDVAEHSEVSQQISGVIEAVNRNETGGASRFEARITASQRLIEEKGAIKHRV
jgi:hypothetical protein